MVLAYSVYCWRFIWWNCPFSVTQSLDVDMQLIVLTRKVETVKQQNTMSQYADVVIVQKFRCPKYPLGVFYFSDCTT